jgi:hypothetical protein
VVKHVDAVKLRVVVAALLAAAADAVLVAHHLPRLGAHLAIALAHLRVLNLTRRSSLEVGNTREKKAGERKKLSMQVWHGKQEILPLKPLVLWVPLKARWVWAGAIAKHLVWPSDHCSSPRPATPRRCRSRRRTTRQMCSGSK